MFGVFSPVIILAAENPVKDNPDAAACVVNAQLWYNEQISKCLTEKSKVFEQFQNMTAEELAKRPNVQKEIQETTAQIQIEQQKCYEGEILAEFKQRNAACYTNANFGGIWELPILKQALVDQMADYQNLSPEKSQQLSGCLESVAQKYDLKSVSATTQTAISQCFTRVGLKGLASLYQKISVVVDCAQAKFPIKTAADVTRIATNQSPDDRAYLEQCVIKKTAPVITAAAVLNLPLTSGWRSIFLFGQLLVTQPIVLLRRRKYKTWGTVFDTVTTNPVDLSSVRLIETKANRVISTTVTDRHGSYLFLPTPGNYKVEVDRPGYRFPSALLGRHAYERDEYFGEPIVITQKQEVIDRHIPVDPNAKPLPVWQFRMRQWRYRFATLLGFVSPAISIIGFILVPKWWIGLFVAAHLLVFGIFVRLSIREHTRKFGLVRDKNKKSISGVTVSLFRRGDNKLLNYYVTDMFGRYYFPRLIGDYTLEFAKDGFKKKELAFSIHHEDSEKLTVKYDVVLEKV